MQLVVVLSFLQGLLSVAERTAQLWIDQSCGEKIVFLYECF